MPLALIVIMMVIASVEAYFVANMVVKDYHDDNPHMNYGDEVEELEYEIEDLKKEVEELKKKIK